MTGPMDSPERLWRTQFYKQLNDEMMERVLKQTSLLVRQLERKTPWRDQLSPDDRLHEAIAKILEGTLRWDPTRVTLDRFLLGAISGDISHELEHAERFRHTSLDDEQQDLDDLERATSEAIEDGRATKREVPNRVWWSNVMIELRKHVGEDRNALGILDAFDHSHYTRGEIMEFARLTSKQHNAAFKRITQAARKIDDDTLALVVQALA